MTSIIGRAVPLSAAVLLASCTPEAPNKESEAATEAPMREAEAGAAEAMLASLKAKAAVGLNVPITIQLDANGNPKFLGSNGSGIICGNPMCQPPTVKDKSYSYDGGGNVVLDNWDGAVQFVITVAAPGYLFPTDVSQAVAITAGNGRPGKGAWNSQFTQPVESPDRTTISFSDKNSQDGVWEYGVWIQNTATGQLVPLDPKVTNGGIGTKEPAATP